MVNKTALPPINWRGWLLDSNQRPVTFSGRKLSSASHQGSTSWRPNYKYIYTHTYSMRPNYNIGKMVGIPIREQEIKVELKRK